MLNSKAANSLSSRPLLYRCPAEATQPALELYVLPPRGGETNLQKQPKYRTAKPNGTEGDRTPDLCNAIAALSQLSYVPKLTMQNAKLKMQNAKEANVEFSEIRPTRQGHLMINWSLDQFSFGITDS